jgi:hypothetical protein
MRDALNSAVTMWVIAWRASPLKMSVAVLLTALSGLSWPLFALAVKVGTDAVGRHDSATATAAGVGLGLAATGALLFNHFAYVPYAEATESAVVSLETDLMTIAND